MAKVLSLNKTALGNLNRIRRLESRFQTEMASNLTSLEFVSEYVFLSAYKAWEKYVEELFIALSRYNEKVGRKRPFPYIAPNTELRAKDLLRLEKDYLDWTSPDVIVKRAEILFKNHEILTIPIVSNIDILRDAKKLRNHIAHESDETQIQFSKIARRRLNRNVASAGAFLLSNVRGSSEHYNLHFINLFENLITDTSA